jgi:hypothetical protein
MISKAHRIRSRRSRPWPAWLLLDRLVNGTLEVTGYFGAPIAYLAHLIGRCTGNTFDVGPRPS